MGGFHLESGGDKSEKRSKIWRAQQVIWFDLQLLSGKS